MKQLLALPYEVWKDIKDYEGYYQVSNLGRVKSIQRLVKKRDGFKTIQGSILKPHIDKKKRIKYCLSKNGKHCYPLCHRLVAQAFIPNPDNKPCIDHINTDTTDNRVVNLRWVTHKENSNNPLTRKHLSENCVFNGKYGKDNHLSKPVLQYDKNGNFLKEWECSMSVYRELSIFSSHIYDCCNGKRKTAGGYIWKYA